MLLDSNSREITYFIRMYLTEKWMSSFIADQISNYNIRVNAKAPTFAITEDRMFKTATNRFTGLVESLRVSDSDWWKRVSITFFDPDDGTYSQLGIKLDRHAYTILSSLLTADLTKPVTFNIYTDKNGYAALSLWQNNAMLKWHPDYSMVELAKQTEGMKDSEKESLLEDLFIKVVEELNSMPKAEMKVTANTDVPFKVEASEEAEVKATKAKKNPKDLTDDDSTLPFN